MYDRDLPDLDRDAADTALPESVRLMAQNLATQLRAYARLRLGEARRPTDPAGHTMAKPKGSP